MTLQKVKPGDPLVIPAPTFNTFVDAANDFLARRQDQFQGSRPAARHSKIVLVRNDSGADRARFDVLGIDAPVFGPADAWCHGHGFLSVAMQRAMARAEGFRGALVDSGPMDAHDSRAPRCQGPSDVRAFFNRPRGKSRNWPWGNEDAGRTHRKGNVLSESSAPGGPSSGQAGVESRAVAASGRRRHRGASLPQSRCTVRAKKNRSRWA